MNDLDELTKEKIYKIKKEYTLLFFGFLTSHCYITTLLTTRNLQDLFYDIGALNSFLNPLSYLVILFFIKWNTDMNLKIEEIIKSEM